MNGVLIRSPLQLARACDDRESVVLEVTVGERCVVPDQLPDGELVAECVVSGRRVYSGVYDGACYVLRVHGVCDYLLDEGLESLECRPDPNADLEVVALLMRGVVLAFYLGLSGDPTLHASAVETPNGGATVFVGVSGMGKSTVAALCCADGARLIADDMVRLDRRSPHRWVGSSKELRLRAGAEQILYSGGADWEPSRTVDGRIAASPPPTLRLSGPVEAVVVPRPDRGARVPKIERLDAVQSALVLLGTPRLTGWQRREVVEAHLHAAARLAESVPVFTATIPWGPPFRAGTGKRLLESVSSSARGDERRDGLGAEEQSA